MGRQRAKSYAERVHAYAHAVVAGKAVAGRRVVLACKRHLSDLAAVEGGGSPYAFSAEKANRVCAFAENMVHVKGKWAGQRVRLEEWQVFLLGCLFGWVREDGLRRFRELYAEIPRKNGKSMLGAIIGNYLLVADAEPGAEVYSGATTLDQALEVFRPAWMMTLRNHAYREHFGIDLGGTEKNPGTIYQLASASRFEAVVGKPGDGASPHGALVDEFHEHKTPDLYDTMKTGMGARTQPLLVVITTAGVDTSAPCYEHRDRLAKELEAGALDPTVLVIMFGVDESDDWKDFAVWRKANPNFGVSLHEDYLRDRYREAMTSPARRNIILCKHLNKWMNAGQAWTDMVKWAECAAPGMRIEDFAGHRAWLGLDLASRTDVASLLAVVEDGKLLRVFARHYLPSDTVEKPQNAHYRSFRDVGALTVSDGARTDFGQIEDDMRAWADLLDVQAIGYDPREATFLMDRVARWAAFDIVEVTQGPGNLSEPMKELEARIASCTIRHADDPVLTWMMGNVVLKQARGGGPVKYFYPTKERESSKIDGAVALIMAVGRALAAPAKEPEIFAEVW